MTLYLASYNPHGQGKKPAAHDITNGPCPTVISQGIGNHKVCHIWIIEAATKEEARREVVRLWEGWQATLQRKRNGKRHDIVSGQV